MKCINYAIVVLLCFLTLGNIVQAQTEAAKKPEPWENPNLTPTQRWEIYLDERYKILINNNTPSKKFSDRLKSDSFEKYIDQINMMVTIGFLGFWRENKRPILNLDELYRTEVTYPFDQLKYQITPLINPLSKQPIKIVPFSNPSPGDISYLNCKTENGVDAITIVIWNKNIFNYEKENIRLIEANGGLGKFIYRNQLYGHNYFRYIRNIIPKGIKSEIHFLHLPGQPYVYPDNYRSAFIKSWGDLLEGYEGFSKPELPVDFSDPLFKPLEITLSTNQCFAQFIKEDITPEKRWQIISDYLQSEQPLSIQNKCKEDEKETHLIKQDYVFRFGIQQFVKQFSRLPSSYAELIDTKLLICSKEVKISRLQSIYYLRPVQQTLITVPAPGDVSWFVDNPNNPQKLIAIIWSQAPDNEEMYWLQLFDKQYGFLKFCINPETTMFRFTRRTFLSDFSNSIDRVYQFSIDKDGKLMITE